MGLWSRTNRRRGREQLRSIVAAVEGPSTTEAAEKREDRSESAVRIIILLQRATELRY